MLSLLFLGTISLFFIFKANFTASAPPVGYKIVPVKTPSFTNSTPPFGPLSPSTPINLILFFGFFSFAIFQAL